jgi:hypothetical protein
MTIIQCAPDSFLLDLTQGVQDFQAAGDTFKVALYYATASLDTSTTAYTATGEVAGTGYTAGGATLTSVDPVISDNKAIIDYVDVTFSAVTLTAVAGAMLYNSSQSNAVCAVLKFDPVTAAAQDIVLTFPGATATSAIIRIRQVSNG